MIRSRLMPWALLLALLFAQQVGWAHVLHHTLATVHHQDGHGTPSSPCQDCEHQAQFGHALPTLPPIPILPPQTAHLVNQGQAGSIAFSIDRACARDPPQSFAV